MNLKNIYIRTLNGFKKGLLTPTLPEEILAFQRKPLIRVLRVLGGLSLLSLLGRSFLNLSGFFLYLALFFTTVFLLYHIYILNYRLKHINKIFKSKDLDVKNSPLDKYASIIAKVVFCAKGLCETAQPVGLSLGLMLGFDEVLKSGGRDAYFAPMLGSAINSVLESELSK